MANKITFVFEVDDKGKVNVDRITKGFEDLDKAIDKVNKNIREQTDALKQSSSQYDDQITNAGLASATLTEFGRTISDLPYGIRGIANNLSQLSALFFTLIGKSKGMEKGVSSVRAAFNALGTQLRGPLGIILVFQAIIALIDAIAGNKIPFLADKNEELKESFDDTTVSISRARIEMQLLSEAAEEAGIASLVSQVNDALSKRGDTLGSINELYEEFKRLRIEAAKEGTNEAALAAVKAEEALQVALIKTMKARKESIKVEEQFNEETGKLEKDSEALEARRKITGDIIKAEDKLIQISGRRLKLEGKRGKIEALSFDFGVKRTLKDRKIMEGNLKFIQKYFNVQEEGIKKLDLVRLESTLTQEELNYRLSIIDAERLDVVATTTANISRLLGERTAAGKAFAIATATIDTYAAANLALNDKTIPSTTLRFVAAAGVIASGLANVKQILSVDETGRSSGASGRAGQTGQGSGQAAQAPIFNVVGQSGVNQLGQTIAAARSEPMRAYVVANDITNAQELENKIIQQSTLG